LAARFTKRSESLEGHLMSDHVHMMIAISPKHAVSQVVGFIERKSKILLARVYGERKRTIVGTVGRDEAAVRDYVRNREKEDGRLERVRLWR
jgi:putative transposase